ncbi:transcription factor IIb, putative [Plasmodium reichenowi]|uniref:Transcription factor IIb, putative n=1 Tax=Plasmodium reichenowi TaxID=5854 RepID=A0A151LQR8_PLARE|nr:transcription factor IIb, putative [Plasmodium reichenowi]KYO01516.1 transcription factor IIb, putative [Plasmodium reichenowi]
MYRNKYQPNILSLLLSAGSKPLEIWKTKTKKGCVRKVLDDTIKLSAIEILSENTSDSYIYTAPQPFKSLSITLPIIVLIIKNMNKYFSFRISILDDKRCRRTFRISNFQTVTRLSNKWCTMPMVLNEGWNIIQINLNDYTEKAFRTKYKETIDIQINASIRIRCVYFCDRIYKNEELKDEFKIFCKKKEKPKYTPPQYLNTAQKKTTIKNVIKTKNLKREDMEAENEQNEAPPNNEQNEAPPNDEKNEAPSNEENVVQDLNKDELSDNLESNPVKNFDTDFENKNDGEEKYLIDVIDNAEEDREDKILENQKEENENENPYNEVDITNISEIKNLEMDLNNVLYEDVNYETYNNDDN